MSNISIISLYGLFFGIIGTTLGGIIGAFLNIRTNKLLGFILEFASGLMLAVTCFDLIPEALEIGDLSICLLGIILGIILMIICNEFIKNIEKTNLKVNNNSILKTGLIVAIGLAIHNFPEGLAIGSGFEISKSLGLKLAFAIAIHDIPEGLSISVPLKNGGESKIKSIMITLFSGITTGLGAFIGSLIGNMSVLAICFSLSVAAGAMLYIVSCELIPESKKIYNGKFSSFGSIIGLITGLLAQNI